MGRKEEELKRIKYEIISVVLILVLFSIIYLSYRICAMEFMLPIFLGIFIALQFFFFYDLFFVPWYKNRKK